MSGPLIGGGIRDAYAVNGKGGFRETCDVMAICSAVVALLYFCVNIVPQLICKKEKRGISPKFRMLVNNKLDGSLMVHEKGLDFTEKMI